ncbi:MAG: hypothetical protein MJ000_04645, partial [Bacteroidales bacterium]|nr:hypothetical protein [Bacteroidales bacterium]
LKRRGKRRDGSVFSNSDDYLGRCTLFLTSLSAADADGGNYKSYNRSHRQQHEYPKRSTNFHNRYLITLQK